MKLEMLENGNLADPFKSGDIYEVQENYYPFIKDGVFILEDIKKCKQSVAARIISCKELKRECTMQTYITYRYIDPMMHRICNGIFSRCILEFRDALQRSTIILSKHSYDGLADNRRSR